MDAANNNNISKLVQWPKIFLLGDSQTQQGYSADGCWVSILSHHFQRKCDVINRGFDGYNCRWVKEMLPAVINEELAKECAAVTLFLGSNDANIPSTNPEHHIPLDEYKASLMWIGQYLLNVGVSKEKIIYIAPPPVDKQLWSESLVKDGRSAEHGLMNEVLAEYATACCAAAKELGVDCIDLYTEMIQSEDWKKYVNVDGLHLAKAGGELLAQQLIPKLEKIAPDFAEIFPNWADVNNDNHKVHFQCYLG